MKLALLGLSLLAATPAAAQEAPPPPPPPGGMIMRADTNGDGTVTREEYVAQATERFARLDANGDGKLTREELDRFAARWRGMRGHDGPPPPAGAPRPQD